MLIPPHLDSVGCEVGPGPLLGHVVDLVEPPVVLDLLQGRPFPAKENTSVKQPGSYRNVLSLNIFIGQGRRFFSPTQGTPANIPFC